MKVMALHVFCLLLGFILIGRTDAACSELGKKCKDNSFRRDPSDCQFFCQCAHKRWYQKTCPPYLVWDEKHNTCNWPDNVVDCEGVQGMCKNNPCKNGGTCMSKHASYQCKCAPGFSGMDCTMVQDSCAENPCQNGGRCQRSRNSVQCECPPGFEGNYCQDATCQRYECPRGVVSFNYPDWQDRTCRSYFSCQRGNLRPRRCPGNQVFSFMLLRCAAPEEMEIPCVLNFVDSAVN